MFRSVLSHHDARTFDASSSGGKVVPCIDGHGTRFVPARWEPVFPLHNLSTKPLCTYPLCGAVFGIAVWWFRMGGRGESFLTSSSLTLTLTHSHSLGSHSHSLSLTRLSLSLSLGCHSNSFPGALLVVVHARHRKPLRVVRRPLQSCPLRSDSRALSAWT
jgi:hypothetical protein